MLTWHKGLAPPAPFAELEAESLAEGYTMLRHLRRNWQDGSNCFDRPGEILWHALSGATLLAIGGLNRDPYPDGQGWGRIRHLYVRRDARRSGLGRTLLAQLVTASDGHFPHLRLRAPEPAFAFYEKQGFTPVLHQEFATHVLIRDKAAGTPQSRPF